MMHCAFGASAPSHAETRALGAPRLTLRIVLFFGQVTRAQIEAFRRAEGIPVDSASLLERMTQSGLLCKVRTDRGLGAPNVYSACRDTASGLRARCRR